MLCNTQQWVIRWSFKFWVFTFLNLPPKIKCWVALTKVFFNQIFLHFGQFYLYSRNVCNKRLANCTAVTDTLALNGFTRNAKHGFDSWKWSNLARNSSSSLTIYLSILPLCGLQLTDRQTDRQVYLTSEKIRYQGEENDRKVFESSSPSKHSRTAQKKHKSNSSGDDQQSTNFI